MVLLDLSTRFRVAESVLCTARNTAERLTPLARPINRHWVDQEAKYETRKVLLLVFEPLRASEYGCADELMNFPLNLSQSGGYTQVPGRGVLNAIEISPTDDFPSGRPSGS